MAKLARSLQTHSKKKKREFIVSSPESARATRFQRSIVFLPDRSATAPQASEFHRSSPDSARFGQIRQGSARIGKNRQEMADSSRIKQDFNNMSIECHQIGSKSESKHQSQQFCDKQPQISQLGLACGYLGLPRVASGCLGFASGLPRVASGCLGLPRVCLGFVFVLGCTKIANIS